jgi:hypothetical protein
MDCIQAKPIFSRAFFAHQGTTLPVEWDCLKMKMILNLGLVMV